MTDAKRRFKVVWPDMPELMARVLGAKAGELEYALSFLAESEEAAEQIAREAGADKMGPWVIEEVR